jgi:hypothetical protein
MLGFYPLSSRPISSGGAVVGSGSPNVGTFKSAGIGSLFPFVTGSGSVTIGRLSAYSLGGLFTINQYAPAGAFDILYAQPSVSYVTAIEAGTYTLYAQPSVSTIAMDRQG